MTHDALLKRISIDPAVCGGNPCVRGHRIWVFLFLDHLASGMTTDQIAQEYRSSRRRTLEPAWRTDPT